MRAEFDARVGPQRVVSPQRFVWDYWHIPGQYSYVRTFARQFFSPALYREFATAVSKWGEVQLGCTSFTEPWLSYYIDGCGQELHSDVVQGAWSFVFSLTHWDERHFMGGETVLLGAKTLDYWRHFDPTSPLEGDQIFDRMPPHFNQLLIFDGRIPHGVARVIGSRDPLDSRVVVHGWFREPTLHAEGGMSSRELEQSVKTLIERWQRDRPTYGRLNGLVTIRLRMDAGGTVLQADVLATNLVSLDGRLDGVDGAVTLALNEARFAQFPAARSSQNTVVTIPFSAKDR